ncbi:MAG: sortase [Parcubacteria group bacterium]|jgi:LPXTG-site transpeptidase (sortase) family protein
MFLIFLANLFKQYKEHWKKATLTLGLFLGIFFLLFNVVNFDFSSVANSDSNDKTEKKSAEEENKWQFKKKPLSVANAAPLSANEWTREYGLDDSNNKPGDDPDGDGLPNKLEYAHMTDPLKADTDGDGYSDKQEIINGYDPDAPGDARPNAEIIITKIGVSAPVIWSKNDDETSLQEDLKKGVVHFPKSASPGQDGNMVISGHSSNYVWVKGSYNYIFKNLNNLEKNDEIKIKVTQQNKRIINYTYKIIDKRTTTADDPFIFEQTANPSLTLSTCWPIGTALKRLVVRAELVK